MLAYLVVILLSSCASQGGKQLADDHQILADSISQSMNREVLLSIVRLRFHDWPEFTEISKVILRRNWEHKVSVNAEFQVPDTGQDIYKPAYLGKISFNPRVVYQPLSGQQYSKSILTPPGISSMFSLIQAGYSANTVLRHFLAAVNGYQNTFADGNQVWAADPVFIRFADFMRNAQLQNALNIGRHYNALDQEQLSLRLHTNQLDSASIKEWRQLQELLGISSESEVYQLISGFANDDSTVIALRTRSIIEFASILSLYVEVPQRLLDRSVVEEIQWKTTATGNAKQHWNFRVRSGSKPPADAFTAVPYRGYWYWIDDTDPGSKSSLQVLLFLLHIIDSGKSFDNRIVIPVNN